MLSNKISVTGIAAAFLVSAIALFGAYGVASAATIPTIKFDNGQVTTQCTAGQNVNAVVRINIPVGEVVELVQADVLGDALAPELPFSVGGANGLEEGQHDVNVSFPCPPNTATFTAEIRTAGIYGGLSAVVITDGVVTIKPFPGAIRVVGSNSSSVGSGDPIIASLQAMINDLMNQISCMSTDGTWNGTTKSCTQAPAEPAKPAYCSTYAAASAGGTFALQTWLVKYGFMTQAAMNTGPGIYGPKTTAANQAAMVSCL